MARHHTHTALMFEAPSREHHVSGLRWQYKHYASIPLLELCNKEKCLELSTFFKRIESYS